MKEKLTNIFYFLSLLVFIFAFNFQHNPPSGWYQQFLPSFSNMQVSDIFFLDSLTGWAVTGNGQPNDTSGYILKTIDGGDNWNLKFTDFRDFSRIKFLNVQTGFVSGGYATGARIYKSIDGGESWFALNIPSGGQIYFNDMSILNEDTIWTIASNGLVGGVFRTTNGGASWQIQASFGSQNPTRIYMMNANTGFISYSNNTALRKTTNGGFNWVQIAGENGFFDMYFIDSLIGWKADSDLKKTVDGGLNWSAQPLPQLNWINLALKLKVVNIDTLWAVGGVLQWIPKTSNFRGVVYKTTNSGKTWGYQIPDTNINYYQLAHIDFANKLSGWTYLPIEFGFHTKTGGDTTFFTSIKQSSNFIPQEFQLYQNYPNPFNPLTIIRLDIQKTGMIKLIIYNVLGKKISILVNEKLAAGSYEYEFDGSTLPSGVYFYSLITEKNTLTKKMLLTK
jgi:photosystem II stability/assembly factor-like uncharacterized protein